MGSAASVQHATTEEEEGTIDLQVSHQQQYEKERTGYEATRRAVNNILLSNIVGGPSNKAVCEIAPHCSAPLTAAVDA